MSEPVQDNSEISAARRLGCPYLVYTDGSNRQRVMSLLDDWDSITIGRGMGVDLVLAWDENVSRLHCQLERLADSWVIVDDGLSSNGTYVNGELVERRLRLTDGDELRFGGTSVAYHAPFEAPDSTEIIDPA
jgi:pSer/pThr/pTyr-binding forkhead associated (FHA) protein